MTKKRVLLTIILLLLIAAAVIGGFLGYLQLSLFEVEPVEKNALTSYVDKYGLDLLDRKQDDLYEGSIPLSIIEDELTIQLINEMSNEDWQIVSGNLDLNKKNAKINYLSGDFFVPIFYRTEFNIEGDLLKVKLIPLSLGNKQLKLPEFFVDLFYEDLVNLEPEVSLSLGAYNPTEIFAFKEAFRDGDKIFVEMKLNLPKIDDLVIRIREDLNDDFSRIYSQGDSSEKEALDLLLDFDKSPDEYSAKLFEDFLDEGKLIEPMLVLAAPDTLMDIYKAYPILETKIKKSTIIQARGDLIGESVVGYGQYLLEALRQLSDEGNLILAQSYPFDFQTMETITVERLVDRYSINIPERILAGLSMSYVDGKMQIVYASDEGIYIAMNQVSYGLISEELFKNKYEKPVPESGTMDQDVTVYNEIYAAMTAYFGEEIFFRYLKNDSDEAYAIVSLQSDYQFFTLVAARKIDGSFQVTQEGFDNVLELNQLDPDFNMNLVTRMNENNHILILNQKTRNEVISGLKEKGYMDSEEELIFISYDGVKYISIVLSSWEEYIYTIYRGVYLADVYTREVAEQRFADLDPLILLHPNPNREPLTDGTEFPRE